MSNKKWISPVYFFFLLFEFQFQNGLIKIKASDFASKLKSYDDIKKAPFPTDVAYTFGAHLSQAILLAYATGKKPRKKVETQDIVSHSPLSEGWHEVTGCFSNTFNFDIDWNLADTESLAAFRAEAFEVANITSQETLDMLKTEAEKAFTEGITFTDFRKNIKLKGFTADNPYYLRTNFNTAVNNAHLAARYKDAMNDIDILPYFRYVAIMDNNVRDEHAALHGTIKKKNDPFWDKYYPPNGWNCRCSVEEMSETEAKKDPKFDKDPPLIPLDHTWKKNTGKNNSIYGNWIDQDKIVKTDWKGNGLKNWTDIAKNAKDVAPALLKDKSNKELKEYFEKNIVGNVIDTNNYRVKINKEFFDKQLNSRGGQDRIEKMDWIYPTIKNADEIWLQEDKGKHYLSYFKAFKSNSKGGFSVVEIEEGQIRTFYEPEKESYFNNNRKGILIYKK